MIGQTVVEIVENRINFFLFIFDLSEFYLKLITVLIIILKKFRHFQKYSQLCFVINTGPDHSFHFKTVL